MSKKVGKRKSVGSEPKRAKKKNTGKEYELIVRDLYQSILPLHGEHFKSISVEHNAQLDSITTRNEDGSPLKRQIDVYWEFELAGVRFKACVQAKDWNQRVSLGMVDTFRAVLDDIAGQPRGIMISKKGFQSGADRHARTRGIEIWVLNDLEEALSPSRLNLEIDALVGGISKVEPLFDDEWLKQQNIEGSITFNVQGTVATFPINKGNGETLMSFADAIKRAEPDAPGEGEFVGEYSFEEDAFIESGNARCPRLKIKGLRVTVTAQKAMQTVTIKRYVSRLFQSATNSRGYWVDNVGTVRKVGEKVSAEHVLELEYAPGKKKKFRVVMEDAGQPMTKVFAYGSNMDHNQMSERCLSAQVFQNGSMPDFELCFPRTSTRKKCKLANGKPGGVSSIRNAPGQVVEGVIYEIFETDLVNLDRHEGVKKEKSKGSYFREPLPVRLSDGTDSTCWVYFANEMKKGPFVPSAWYKDRMVFGAESNDLPAAYQQQLQAIISG